MADQQIPRKATRITRAYGIDDDGHVIVLSVYQHTPKGDTLPMYYLVQYREVNRRIQRGSRYTRQYSGPRARARLDASMAEPLALLAASIDRFRKGMS
jgi:hypothetical protein